MNTKYLIIALATVVLAAASAIADGAETAQTTSRPLAGPDTGAPSPLAQHESLQRNLDDAHRAVETAAAAVVACQRGDNAIICLGGSDAGGPLVRLRSARVAQKDALAAAKAAYLERAAAREEPIRTNMRWLDDNTRLREYEQQRATAFRDALVAFGGLEVMPGQEQSDVVMDRLYPHFLLFTEAQQQLAEEAVFRKDVAGYVGVEQILLANDQRLAKRLGWRELKAESALRGVDAYIGRVSQMAQFRGQVPFTPPQIVLDATRVPTLTYVPLGDAPERPAALPVAPEAAELQAFIDSLRKQSEPGPAARDAVAGIVD